MPILGFCAVHVILSPRLNARRQTGSLKIGMTLVIGGCRVNFATMTFEHPGCEHETALAGRLDSGI
jgi:hypothetical protein